MNVIDQRYQSLPRFRGVKYFQSGYSLKDLVNPTFTELCHHMSCLLSVVHDLIPLQASLYLRAFFDFYIQVTSKEHSNETTVLQRQTVI